MNKKILAICILELFLLIGLSTLSVTAIHSNNLNEYKETNEKLEPLVNCVAQFRIEITWDDSICEITHLVIPSTWSVNSNPLKVNGNRLVSAQAGNGQRLIGKWGVDFFTNQGHRIWGSETQFDIIEDYELWNADVEEGWNLVKGRCLVQAQCWFSCERYEWNIATEEWEKVFPSIVMGDSGAGIINVIKPRFKSNINTPFLNFLENHPNMFPLLQRLLGL